MVGYNMIDLENIRSLSDFQRNTKSHVEAMREDGKPMVLTVNGEAALVVQDAAAYQELLQRLDRAESLEGIQRGLDAVSRSDVQPAKEAFEDLRKGHGIPRRGDRTR